MPTPEEEQALRDRKNAIIAWTRALNGAYLAPTSLNPLPRDENAEVLDAFYDRLGEVSPPRLQAFYRERPWMLDRIVARAARDAFYRQPTILCLPVWILANAMGTRRLYPFPESELRTLFSDLGEAFRD